MITASPLWLSNRLISLNPMLRNQASMGGSLRENFEYEDVVVSTEVHGLFNLRSIVACCRHGTQPAGVISSTAAVDIDAGEASTVLLESQCP